MPVLFLPGILKQSAKKWLAKDHHSTVAQLQYPRTSTRTQCDFPPTALAIFNLCLVEANMQRRRLLDATDPLSLPVADPISFIIVLLLDILFLFLLFLLFLPPLHCPFHRPIQQSGTDARPRRIACNPTAPAATASCARRRARLAQTGGASARW